MLDAVVRTHLLNQLNDLSLLNYQSANSWCRTISAGHDCLPADISRFAHRTFIGRTCKTGCYGLWTKLHAQSAALSRMLIITSKNRKLWWLIMHDDFSNLSGKLLRIVFSPLWHLHSVAIYLGVSCNRPVVMLAGAYFAMQRNMQVLWSWEDSQSLSNSFTSLGIFQVSHSAHIKLIPKGLLQNLIHVGNFAVCRTPWLFKIKVSMMRNLIPEKNYPQCNLPQMLQSLL